MCVYVCAREKEKEGEKEWDMSMKTHRKIGHVILSDEFLLFDFILWLKYRHIILPFRARSTFLC